MPKPATNLRVASAAALVVAACLLPACADDDEAAVDVSDTGGTGDVPASDATSTDATSTDAASTDATTGDPSIAEELGLLGYAGAATPIEESSEDDVTTYTFDPSEGPMCMRGAEYRVSVRDTGSHGGPGVRQAPVQSVKCSKVSGQKGIVGC